MKDMKKMKDMQKMKETKKEMEAMEKEGGGGSGIMKEINDVKEKNMGGRGSKHDKRSSVTVLP